MPCIPLPKAPVPSLPLPFSVKPPVPPIPKLDANLCCKLPPLPIPTPPIKIPSAVMTGVLPLLQSALAAVNAYLDKLPLKCPRE